MKFTELYEKNVKIESDENINEAKEEIDELKDPFYSISDGIIGVKNTIADDNPYGNDKASKDKKLQKYISDISKAYDVMYKYLDKNYIWD